MSLQLNQLSFSVGDRDIVKQVDLNLASGSICVLLGPNGAGKSTLMRLASGVLQPTEGEAQLGGHSVHAMALPDRARQLSVLTQRNVLDFPFTAEEVVCMGREPFEYSHNDTEIVTALMAALDIEPNAIYTNLSGGERQLVHLARVFSQSHGLGNSGFLMLDEPMAALDLRHQAVVAQMLREQRDQGLGQLIIMHDVNLAASMADQIVLMADGYVIACGDPAEVLSLDNLEQTFSTSMRVIEVENERYYSANLR